MFTQPITFSDAVLIEAKLDNKMGPPPGTIAKIEATFTSPVAAALDLQRIKDLAADSKDVKVRTACKDFKARAVVDGLPFEMIIDGHEAKEFVVFFPEKEQPVIRFKLLSTNRIAEWNELAKALGSSPFELTLTPLQGDLAEAGDDSENEDDRVWPQRELDGSYPFNLAATRHLQTAKASVTLYALEVEPGIWLMGWEYHFLNLGGCIKIGHAFDGDPLGAEFEGDFRDSQQEAFQFAAASLADTLNGPVHPGTPKKERDIIDSICEWLQPIIEGEPEPTDTDLAAAAVEATEG